jgi:hypothetical protein
LFRQSSVCFGCFNTSPKHRNKPKQTEKNVFWFRETQTEKQPKQIEFRLEPKKNLIVSRTPYPTRIHGALQLSSAEKIPRPRKARGSG